MELDTKKTCECDCHFGGAESCQGCKKNHEYDLICELCKKE